MADKDGLAGGWGEGGGVRGWPVLGHLLSGTRVWIWMAPPQAASQSPAPPARPLPAAARCAQLSGELQALRAEAGRQVEALKDGLGRELRRQKVGRRSCQQDGEGGAPCCSLIDVRAMAVAVHWLMQTNPPTHQICAPPTTTRPAGAVGGRGAVQARGVDGGAGARHTGEHRARAGAGDTGAGWGWGWEKEGKRKGHRLRGVASEEHQASHPTHSSNHLPTRSAWWRATRPSCGGCSSGTRPRPRAAWPRRLRRPTRRQLRRAPPPLQTESVQWRRSVLPRETK